MVSRGVECKQERKPRKIEERRTNTEARYETGKEGEDYNECGVELRRKPK